MEQTIAAYYAALNALDADAFVATFAPECVSEDPVGAPPHVGHEGVRGFVNGLVGAFSSVEMTADHTFIADYRAAVKWTVNGVMTSGKSVKLEGIDTFEFADDGKIAKVAGYWDPSPMMG
jgi:steroid delta-isomerase